MLYFSHSNITFKLLFPSEADPVDDFDEGVEFSLLLGSERGWIPITYAFLSIRTDRNNFFSIGTADTEGNVLIRGYSSELNAISRGANTQHSVTICDFEDSVDSVQFRWLQTCLFNVHSTDAQVRDAWTLDNVLITYQDGKNGSFVLFDGSK